LERAQLSALFSVIVSAENVSSCKPSPECYAAALQKLNEKRSGERRLPVLAQRVAPLQICWLDYFDTTAVPAMDTWISDEWLTPRLTTQRYTEHIALLTSGRFCYSPPEAGPATFDGDGPATFGSFNRIAKLNDGVVATWAEILQRVPDATLEIGATLLDDRVAREALSARFERLGIGADRLRLVGARSYADLLEAYRRIDVALDPFPFSGCTTTCDALWMGTAVVTLPGDTFVSRQSASLLWRLGRTDWVAKDRADYVERAVSLTRETYALRCERELVRETMRTQICDASKQATELAALFRTLWRERCART